MSYTEFRPLKQDQVAVCRRRVDSSNFKDKKRPRHLCEKFSKPLSTVRCLVRVDAKSAGHKYLKRLHVFLQFKLA
jgi:hypothetical protein